MHNGAINHDTFTWEYKASVEDLETGQRYI